MMGQGPAPAAGTSGPGFYLFQRGSGGSPYAMSYRNRNIQCELALTGSAAMSRKRRRFGLAARLSASTAWAECSEPSLPDDFPRRNGAISTRCSGYTGAYAL